jgi:hypothetical protein
MEDLQVSDAEQIDLLVKWLGTESFVLLICLMKLTNSTKGGYATP